MSEPIERPGVRIIVLADEEWILLFRYVNAGHSF